MVDLLVKRILIRFCLGGFFLRFFFMYNKFYLMGLLGFYTEEFKELRLQLRSSIHFHYHYTKVLFFFGVSFFKYLTSSFNFIYDVHGLYSFLLIPWDSINDFRVVLRYWEELDLFFVDRMFFFSIGFFIFKNFIKDLFGYVDIMFSFVRFFFCLYFFFFLSLDGYSKSNITRV